jgi:hypothetical protein
MIIATITITQYPSMPWRYKWSVQAGSLRQSGDVPGSGPEGAAAVAIEKSHKYGVRGYTIFAPREVLDQIPADLRSRRNDPR